MKEKEQISWNFASEYYRNVLIPAMQKLVDYTTIGEYYTSIIILDEIFLQINGEIRLNKDTTEYADKIDKLIKKLKEDEKNYRAWLTREGLSSIQKQRRATEYKQQIEQELREVKRLIYYMLTALGMSFPKVKTEIPEHGKEVLG